MTAREDMVHREAHNAHSHPHTDTDVFTDSAQTRTLKEDMHDAAGAANQKKTSVSARQEAGALANAGHGRGERERELVLGRVCFESTRRRPFRAT